MTDTVAVIEEEDVEERADYRSATTRASFQLTYAKSADERKFMPWELTGPFIPCAYHPDQTDHLGAGSWDYGDVPDCANEDEWLAYFFGIAVREAVHEALEWFRVDGRVALDPHGTAENAIHKVCDQLGQDLWALRGGNHGE